MSDRDNGARVLRGLLKRRADPVAAQTPDLPPAPPMTPVRAASAALGRAAEGLYGLAVRPIAVMPGALTLAELPELLPDMPLLAVLQGPGEQLGAIALSPEVATALIEMQALGRVTARPLDRRRPTRSDAALCTDFIDRLLSELGAEMGTIPGYAGIIGYRFLTQLEDVRPLSLMLEDIAYRSLDLRIGLGPGDLREGRIMLVLPQGAGVAPSAPAAVAVDAPAASKPDPAPLMPTLAPRVQDAPVDLAAILCRKTISLGDLRAMMSGKLLFLPKPCLNEARLETRGGQLVAQGRLGEAEGCHALRLTDPAAAPRRALDEGSPSRPRVPAVDLSGPDPFRPGPEMAELVALPVAKGRETA